MQRFVRGNDVLDAGNRRSEMWPGAGRDQNGVGLHLAAVRKPHGVRVRHDRARLRQFHFPAVKGRGVRRFQPRDLAVLVGDQSRPGKDRLLHAPAEAGRIFKIVTETRGVNEQLLRHAAADDTGAADAEFLRDHHLRAVGRGDARGAHAARACSDHEQIDVLRHARIPLQQPAEAGRGITFCGRA
jgi:hypothetical protein